MVQKETRSTKTIDATGQVLGRLASRIAPMLMGKDTPAFTAHEDKGVVVEVMHADKIVVTGKKMEQKAYYHHSMYPKGLKTKQLKTLWQQDAGEALRNAVSRMLPKNKLRNERMKRLIIK